MILAGKILITGGAGYLGRAIIRRAVKENWDCDIAIFSTDAVKHSNVLSQWPQVHSVIGDIRDPATVYNAMVGMDTVIHAAAVKYIDVSEYNSIDTFQVNVNGSLNVLNCAVQLGIPQVVGISTDKCCHAANVYGASKYLMEKLFQEFARVHPKLKFHLVRYGNVIESTLSVVEIWKKAVENHQSVKITDPGMTRFWLSPDRAVDYILASLELESGHIYIPALSALSLWKMAEYIVGNVDIEIIPIRPGEKQHETLLTKEETHYAQYISDKSAFDLSPSTAERHEATVSVFTSDKARLFTKSEFVALLGEAQ